jgi:hypothetical protein
MTTCCAIRARSATCTRLTTHALTAHRSLDSSFSRVIATVTPGLSTNPPGNRSAGHGGNRGGCSRHSTERARGRCVMSKRQVDANTRAASTMERMVPTGDGLVHHLQIVDSKKLKSASRRGVLPTRRGRSRAAAAGGHRGGAQRARIRPRPQGGAHDRRSCRCPRCGQRSRSRGAAIPTGGVARPIVAAAATHHFQIVDSEKLKSATHIACRTRSVA